MDDLRAGDSDRIWRERGLRAAVLAGDESAWRAIHEAHFDSIYAFIRVRTGRRADLADDAVGECWLAAVRAIARFDPERGSLEGWLRGIAANVIRSQARRIDRTRRIEGEAAAGVRAAAGGTAGGAGGETGLRDAVGAALSGLPARYREVLRAKYEEGLAVAAIAARSGESEKAVESLLARARAAFRENYRRIERDER